MLISGQQATSKMLFSLKKRINADFTRIPDQIRGAHFTQRKQLNNNVTVKALIREMLISLCNIYRVRVIKDCFTSGDQLMSLALCNNPAMLRGHVISFQYIFIEF